MSSGGKGSLVLVVPNKPDYTVDQTAFVVKVVAAAHLSGQTVEVKKEEEAVEKVKGSLLPYIRTADMTLFEAEAALLLVLQGKSEEDKKRVEEFGDAFTGLSQAAPEEALLEATKETVSLAGIERSLAKRTQSVSAEAVFDYDWSEIRLPKPGQKNTLITAALPYVNNVPHLGNVIGAVLSADVYARYCRHRGDQVVYVCGTDEFGTATETKALEEGLPCADVCAKYYKLHAAVYDWFQIRFDHFGRTSNAHQTPITHDIFKRLHANGFFFEDAVEQTFCESCDRFLADRYVEGTCPLCGFDDARGDQCDGCGKLINSTELKEPRCKLCKTRPIVKSSRHLFLDLGKLQPQVESFVESGAAKGNWSANSASISRAWLTEGLRPRCMTRDLRWGTPVPVPGFESKVFYVWFDAPIGYLSITAEYAGAGWEAWWKQQEELQGDSKVSLVQFMGKDNVPFHTVVFPATLLGAQAGFTLLDGISTTEYLNYETGKFSKSRGTGVFGSDARDSGIPAALWRYYLLATRPEHTDAAFSWDDFASKCNAELLANVGNLVNRTSKFLWSRLDGRIGPVLSAEDPVMISLVPRINEHLQSYVKEMDAVHIRAALREAMAFSATINGFLTEARLDGKLLASDPERCRAVLSTALNLVYLLSALLEPFLPSVSADIQSILNAPPRRIPTSPAVWNPEEGLQSGHLINQPFILFHKLEESLVAELRARYGGKQQ